MKAVATQILRRTGFRSALAVSTVLTSLAIAASALFTAATSWWVILAVLVVSGMCRSVLLTGIVSLTFADVPGSEMGGATVLSNVLNQIVGAVGISLAAIALNLSAAWRGAAAGPVAASDCRVAILLTAAIGALSLVSFLRLPHDAGAEVSGHRVAVEA